MKNKILIMLLLIVFISSVSCVVAADANSDNSLATDDNDIILTDEDSGELADSGDDLLTTGPLEDDGDGEDVVPTLYMTLSTSKDTFKVGDIVKVHVTVKNVGKVDATDVLASIGLSGNQLKFLEGYVPIADMDDMGNVNIHIGDLAAGETYEAYIPFEAIKSGEVILYGTVTNGAECVHNDPRITITLLDADPVDKQTKSPQKVEAKNAAKTLPATGNPVAILGLVVVLLSCIPYFRRK